MKLLTPQCIKVNQHVLGWQVYRALRNGVQDAAVKLLTNVDAAQLTVFLDVLPTPFVGCMCPGLCAHAKVLKWNLDMHDLCHSTKGK